MTELGMLDDKIFAQTWVESRDRARPRGERAIREELRLKGVDRAVVDPCSTSATTLPPIARMMVTQGFPDRVAAERLVARHARVLARVTDPRQRRHRAYALLARNGFDPETCREVAAMVADRTDERAEDDR
jgi:regulatory protein